MPCFSRKLLYAGAILFLVWGFPPLAVPQAAVVSPLQTASLQQLTRNSGYIFGGTVISVEHLAATGPSGVPTVKITFRVEDAISAVGGALGRFPMNRSGQILLEQTRIASLRLNPAREILWRGKSRISSHEFADAIRYSDIRNTKICSNGVSSKIFPFATQLKATPPARTTAFCPVRACSARSILNNTSSRRA
jgi:hypothetical protein